MRSLRLKFALTSCPLSPTQPSASIKQASYEILSDRPFHTVEEKHTRFERRGSVVFTTTERRLETQTVEDSIEETHLARFRPVIFWFPIGRAILAETPPAVRATATLDAQGFDIRVRHT